MLGKRVGDIGKIINKQTRRVYDNGMEKYVYNKGNTKKKENK